MIVSYIDTIYCKCLRSLVTTNIKLLMVLTVTHQYLRKEQGCMQAIGFGGRLELLMKGHIDSVKLKRCNSNRRDSHHSYQFLLVS